MIVFLNAERIIQEAIESVIGQTSKQWELILINDGSVDGITDIAKQIAMQNH